MSGQPMSGTWLSPDDNIDQHDKPLYNIDCYHDPVRRDRGGRSGGAVLAWISETLVYNLRLDLERADVEILSLEIRCSNNKVLLFMVYRTKEQVKFWDSLQGCYSKALAIGF